jgi:hypothetical protein
MGLLAAGCRLAPYADSLEVCLPDRLRLSLYNIDGNILTCPRGKVKCLSAKDFKVSPFYFCATVQTAVFFRLLVDKTACLWLNEYNKIGKDNDGKLAFTERSREPAVGVSRCGRFWRSDSRVDLVKTFCE